MGWWVDSEAQGNEVGYLYFVFHLIGHSDGGLTFDTSLAPH
jgi:hypothetical protein